MRQQPHAGPQNRLRADDAERPYLDVVGKLRAIGHARARVDARHA
jgi:hypothetical protein